MAGRFLGFLRQSDCCASARAGSCFSRLPYRATISVWVNTSILSIARMRSIRYCDMLSARLGPRTNIQIFLAKLRRKTADWPAELPPRPERSPRPGTGAPRSAKPNTRRRVPRNPAGSERQGADSEHRSQPRSSTPSRACHHRDGAQSAFPQGRGAPRRWVSSSGHQISAPGRKPGR